MFEYEDNNQNNDFILEDDLLNDNPYNPSPKTRKEIERLLSNDKAQRSRTWEFYEKMRVSNPTEYWKPATQLQLHRDAEALGDAFNPGDAND